MKKVLLTIFTSIVVTLSGVGSSFAQDDSGVPDLTPIELQLCNYRDGQDQADYDKAVGLMTKWMDDNDAEPYAAWRLKSLYTGARTGFDFIYLGAWVSGTSNNTLQPREMRSRPPIRPPIAPIRRCIPA